MALPAFITGDLSEFELGEEVPDGGQSEDDLPGHHFVAEGFLGYWQVQDNWCWAAAAVTIQRYLDRNTPDARGWPQCAVAATLLNAELPGGMAALPYRACKFAGSVSDSDRKLRDNRGVRDDCGPASQEAGGRRCWLPRANLQESLTRALVVVGHLSPDVPAQVRTSEVASDALHLRIRQELVANRPVGIRVLIPDRDHQGAAPLRHFLVIRGYDWPTRRYFTWNSDPMVMYNPMSIQTLTSRMNWDVAIFTR